MWTLAGVNPTSQSVNLALNFVLASLGRNMSNASLC